LAFLIAIDQYRSIDLGKSLLLLIDSPRRNENEDQYAAPCGLELLTLIPHGGYDRAIATGVSRLTALVPKLARDERPVGLW
jgi:hypothetical protein